MELEMLSLCTDNMIHYLFRKLKKIKITGDGMIFAKEDFYMSMLTNQKI